MPKPRRPKKPKPPALPLFPVGERWRFEIPGPPRTKKNHQVIGRRRDGTPFIMGADVTRTWGAHAISHLRSQWHRAGAINQPVSVRAGIFRDRATGDTNGFYQAIGDALEGAGVIMNDSLIEHWDGSRRLKDAANPRVVIILSTVS